MLNQVQIIGNLVRDIELKQTTNGIPVTQFTLAVQRDFKTAEGEYETDFINCVAWRGTAEFLKNYFKKGNRVSAVGRLQVRQFETENGTRNVTEVIVDKVYNLTPRDTVTRVESASSPQDFMNDEYAENSKALVDDNLDLPF